MKKKKEKGIFDGIRKPTAPPSQRMKTRKRELDRKKKHKGKDEKEE
jgi:hypothetical protein